MKDEPNARTGLAASKNAKKCVSYKIKFTIRLCFYLQEKKTTYGYLIAILFTCTANMNRGSFSRGRITNQTLENNQSIDGFSLEWDLVSSISIFLKVSFPIFSKHSSMESVIPFRFFFREKKLIEKQSHE
ncbi:hypothetical protein BpHYR1_008225 [Brachionus plicatilis]|uniref:Uncharacterized protein n=1 Tax=Brachionus plicatilis TaxID=10195 RepID=A0A3M7T5J5_BRAPC|nr:hypothetical protein BpHYR1_008225 [Brachionus plicatilis]